MRIRLAGAVLGVALAAAACSASPVSAPAPVPTPVAGREAAAPPAESVFASAPFTIPGPRPRLAWPHWMESALAVSGYGFLGASPRAGERPIASVAKVMTAYQVLLDHPIGRAPGPSITVGTGDVALFRQDEASGQSAVLVRAGERLSERQALLALLLPSANNVATMLARWDAGSLPNFVARMNATARSLGLASTHYADASGFDPRTVSTAADQVRLAIVAMANPTFAALVSTPATRIPVDGWIHNVNALLGHDGVVGLKTGTTGPAGACLVFAAVRVVDGHRVLLVGAILGSQRAELLSGTFAAATRLLAQGTRALGVHTAIAAGAVVGQVRNGATPIAVVKAARPVQVLGWPGLPVSVQLAPPTPPAGLTHLSVTAQIGSHQVPVATSLAAAG